MPCLRSFQPFIVEGGMRNQVLAGTLRVLYGYSQGTYRVLTGYSQGTLTVLYGYSQGTHRVLAGTLRVLYGYGVAPPQPSAAAIVCTHVRVGRSRVRRVGSKQARKQTNEQANEQANKQASEQASD